MTKRKPKKSPFFIVWILPSIVAAYAILDILTTPKGWGVEALRIFTVLQSLAVLIYSISKLSKGDV